MIIDLTAEFPELCINRTRHYLDLPCWDGQPPSPHEIDRAAKLCASRHLEGDVLVHCAHGKGRSTCVLCACLVRAGLFATWRDAFDAVRPIDSRCLGPRLIRGHRAHRARTLRIGAYQHPGTQVRPRRKGVKLNAMMRDALDAWEAGHGQSWSDKAA